MSRPSRLRESLLSLAERFVPPHITDLDAFHRTRGTIVQAWAGIGFSATFGILYAFAGSPWSGASILLITVGLIFTPSAVRRGASLVAIGNALIALTWIATFIVSFRSGGFTSPAVAWTFLFPLCTYAACGARSAFVWAILSGLQLLVLFVAELAGVQFAQDFSPRLLAILRVSGYAGVVLTTIVMLTLVETVRQEAFAAIRDEARARDRARILDDMHDGLGGQLLGILVQLRAGQFERPTLQAALESCLDDLRLIVASLDAPGLALSVGLGELRARVEPRCQALDIELHWTVVGEDALDLDPARSLHVLRALQESLTNAIRHSETKRIEVHVEAAAAGLSLRVRDFGVGFNASRATRGRGMKSLRARALKLGAKLVVEANARPWRRALDVPAKALEPVGVDAPGRDPPTSNA